MPSEDSKPVAAVQKAGTSGQSGLFGGGDQIDAHSVKLSKALDYRLVCSRMFYSWTVEQSKSAVLSQFTLYTTMKTARKQLKSNHTSFFSLPQQFTNSFIYG